jgi:hypothetical protein
MITLVTKSKIKTVKALMSRKYEMQRCCTFSDSISANARHF